MSKARDIADILSASTSIATDAEVASSVSAAVSTHATAANGHVGRGTTASRPASPTLGDLYFDTTLNALIAYRTAGWEKVSQDPAPQIASISPTTAATTGTTVAITGSNFKSALAVQFIGTNNVVYNSPVASFVSATTATATTPGLPVAYEPYDVKVINADNQFAILDNCLDSGGTPVWNTASGSIGSVVKNSSMNLSVSATDPDATSIIYSSSNLPAWITLNSSTGALTGTAPDVSSDTLYSFDIVASDGVNTSSRAFNISVILIPILTGGTLFSDSTYQYRVFASGTSSLSVSAKALTADILVVAGGGGGGTAAGGGGGAGGIGYTSGAVLAIGSYSTLVGAGGSGATGDGGSGANGGNSVFNTITAYGGGGGNHGGAGAAGGSGGGCGYSNGPGGSATQGTGAASHYGNAGGGFGRSSSGSPYPCGGGGGAGAAGGISTEASGGAGGVGLSTWSSWGAATGYGQNISGTYWFGGGGGGSRDSVLATGGNGGGGAGGTVITASANKATDGLANTGGGGGGGDVRGTTYPPLRAGNGGSGIIIVRYTKSQVGA
jgi:hypothetical protein